MLDQHYYLSNLRLETYVGKLTTDCAVYGDENDLEWISVTENFFDKTRFAGEGNLGHIYEQIKYYKLGA